MKTATVEEMKGWLDNWFYKPGWAFEITKDWSDRPLLRIRMDTVDSTTFPIDPNKMVTVGQTCYLPLGAVYSERDFEKWVFFEIMRLEKHEAQEWFRSFEDGKPLDDPHAYDRRV